MSLTPEQIDAFTIAVEQEIEDNETGLSVTSEEIVRAISEFDSETKQREIIAVCAELSRVYFDVVDEARQEREAKTRAKAEAEMEAVRSRSQERHVTRQAAVYGGRIGGYVNPNGGGGTVCGVNGCPVCAPQPGSGLDRLIVDDSYYASSSRSAVFTAPLNATHNYSGWNEIGYTTDWNIDSNQPLPEWERALLDGDPTEQDTVSTEGDEIEAVKSTRWARERDLIDALQRQMQALARATHTPL